MSLDIGSSPIVLSDQAFNSISHNVTLSDRSDSMRYPTESDRSDTKEWRASTAMRCCRWRQGTGERPGLFRGARALSASEPNENGGAGGAGEVGWMPVDALF